MSDHESDSEDEAAETLYKPSFVLIAIDAHQSMFVKKQQDEITPFKDSISACFELANSLIFTTNKRSWSPFGIVLANEDSRASFINFNDSMIDSIKLLKERNELTEDELRQQYERVGALDLSAFFLFCKKKFREVKSAFYRRTVIFITSDDNPVNNDKSQRFAALNEAKNFEANNIKFEVVTMDKNFNYKLFYNELFSIIGSPQTETLIEDQDGLVDKLSSEIILKYEKRKLKFFPFIGDKAHFLKVVQNKYISAEKIHNNAFVTKAGTRVQKVMPKNAALKQTFTLPNIESDEFEEFTLEEYTTLYNNALEIGYTLIYVSKRITDVGFVLTDSKVLEMDQKEALPFFNYFWQFCVDKNRVLVCARKLRDKDKLRFVELIPKFMNKTKVFLIKTIPFIDECTPSCHAVEDKGDSSLEQINVIATLVDKLTIDYNSKMYVNPQNAKKKAFLRAKLLDEPQEEVQDVTANNAKEIDSHVANISDNINQLFNLGFEGEEKGTKRKHKSAPAASRKKK